MKDPIAISGKEVIFPGYEIEVVVGCGFGVKRGKCCSYGSSISREVELGASGGSWDRECQTLGLQH